MAKVVSDGFTSEAAGSVPSSVCVVPSGLWRPKAIATALRAEGGGSLKEMEDITPSCSASATGWGRNRGQRAPAGLTVRRRGGLPPPCLPGLHSAKPARSSRSRRATSTSLITPARNSATSFTRHTNFGTSSPSSREPKTYASRNKLPRVCMLASDGMRRGIGSESCGTALQHGFIAMNSGCAPDTTADSDFTANVQRVALSDALSPSLGLLSPEWRTRGCK